MYAQDSIELLKNSGIDFVSNEARGIDVQQFGASLMTSGIVLNDEVSQREGFSCASKANFGNICIHQRVCLCTAPISQLTKLVASLGRTEEIVSPFAIRALPLLLLQLFSRLDLAQ